MLPTAVGFQERTICAKKEERKRESWYTLALKFQERRRSQQRQPGRSDLGGRAGPGSLREAKGKSDHLYQMCRKLP